MLSKTKIKFIAQDAIVRYGANFTYFIFESAQYEDSDANEIIRVGLLELARVRKFLKLELVHKPEESNQE